MKKKKEIAWPFNGLSRQMDLLTDKNQSRYSLWLKVILVIIIMQIDL